MVDVWILLWIYMKYLKKGGLLHAITWNKIVFGPKVHCYKANSFSQQTNASPHLLLKKKKCISIE